MPAEPSIVERARAQFERRGGFAETSFLAALGGFRGNMQTGTLDLTFSVGPGEKEQALKVTDAPGELLLVTVERVSMKGASNGGKPGAKAKPRARAKPREGKRPVDGADPS